MTEHPESPATTPLLIAALEEPEDHPQPSSQAAPSPDALQPWGASGPAPIDKWREDILGPGFESQTLPLLPDEEGDACATLIRHRPDQDLAWDELVLADTALAKGFPSNPARFIVLYLHGRNDYFFNKELARQISASGGIFYALDLRKYGRSLRPHQTIGYITDLDDYDEEIGIALEHIRSEHPQVPLTLMGHSTGGLIATMWAYRHPGALAGLILNSAWLELQTLSSIRPAMQQVVGMLAARRPRATIVSSKHDTYGRSLRGGWADSGFPLPIELRAYPEDPAITGWEYSTEWKRPDSYPAPAAWFEAIMKAQQFVEKEVHLDIPVLSMCSTQSVSEAEWTPQVFSADVVLQVELIVERSATLSDSVMIVRTNGRHDMFLSDPPSRRHLYSTLTKWIEAFIG